jgi:hypothetical protein
MAGDLTPNDDPGRIDVSLNLFGDQSASVVKSLADQLKANHDLMQAIISPTSQQQALNFQRLAQTLQGQAQAAVDPGQWQSRPEPAPIYGPKGELLSTGRDRSADIGEAPTAEHPFQSRGDESAQLALQREETLRQLSNLQGRARLSYVLGGELPGFMSDPAAGSLARAGVSPGVVSDVTSSGGGLARFFQSLRPTAPRDPFIDPIGGEDIPGNPNRGAPSIQGRANAARARDEQRWRVGAQGTPMEGTPAPRTPGGASDNTPEGTPPNAAPPPSEGMTAPPGTDDGFYADFGAAGEHLYETDFRQGFTMPRFGEFTTQDKLQMASDWLARRSYNSQERAYQEARAEGLDHQAALAQAHQQGGQTSTLAAGLNVAASNAAQIAAASATARSWFGMSDEQSSRLGIDLRPGTATERGRAMGFDPRPGRGGQFQIGPVGFTLPGANLFSDAAAEGYRQQRSVIDLAAMAGITRAQAREARDQVAGSGWSGVDFENIMHSMAPLMQQGLGAQNIMPFMDRAQRMQTATVDQVTEQLDHLGDSAKNARMTLDEYSQALNAAGEAMEPLGVTHLRGVQRARAFSDITGMPPQALPEMLQNPMVQGFTMAQGILPNEAGLMSTAGQIGTIGNAVQSMYHAMAPYGRMTVRTPGTSGMGATRISGHDRQNRYDRSIDEYGRSRGSSYPA